MADLYDLLRGRYGEARAFAQCIHDATSFLEIMAEYSSAQDMEKKGIDMSNICARASMYLTMLNGRPGVKCDEVIAALKRYEAQGVQYVSDIRQDLENALGAMKHFAERRVA